MILYGNYIYAIHVHLMSKHFGLTRKCITPCYNLLRTYYMCIEQFINYYNLNIVQREPVHVCNACYKKHLVKSTSRASEVINTLEESRSQIPHSPPDCDKESSPRKRAPHFIQCTRLRDVMHTTWIYDV